ncbi:hypothetical protein Skr01_65600 [Sphaerisporangium krabiense]|uniref:Uncharacterized protein n=1 Tax=Sphaerisporangium krabiense TaxID=763782 RepID=A0A7W8Z0D0_9ACTN|nr:SCO2522 family protein [Sphaerisporangium krabiense]MBB5624825.1 hypothetical protein [Sphaerisporangium krabiense]GII66475.1 hypothetical protein Skr01_65600 [Sphaerisporangium krabiense]
MTSVDAAFGETSAERRVSFAPLSHVSVELGHLYMEDFQAGPERLEAQFRRVAPWLEAVRSAWRGRVGSQSARISTCFLIDDYFSRFGTPAALAPMVLDVAERCGLRVDYLARESACATADGLDLARLVADRIVSDPPPGTNGSRPPVMESGWLCNGVRSPSGAGAQAMGKERRWAPPVQNAKRGHSVFVDVELWDEKGAERVWSCPFLASVWQLLRLGALRDNGALPVRPRPRPAAWPEDWDALPAVVRLRDDAAPFTAYTTMSVLSPRFLPVELAVRTILSQVAVDPEVLRQLKERGGEEGVELADELVDRVFYVFG